MSEFRKEIVAAACGLVAVGLLAGAGPSLLKAESSDNRSSVEAEAEADAKAGADAESKEKESEDKARGDSNCRASASASASATSSDGQTVTRHDEDYAEESAEGCSVTSRSSATSRSSGQKN